MQVLGEYPAWFPEQSYVDQDGARGKAGVEKRQHAAHIRNALDCETVALQIRNKNCPVGVILPDQQQCVTMRPGVHTRNVGISRANRPAASRLHPTCRVSM